MVWEARGLHPGSDVDCISPDVVLRFPGADDAGHYRPDVQAYPEHEAVVRILVDAAQLLAQAEDELDQLKITIMRKCISLIYNDISNAIKGRPRDTHAHHDEHAHHLAHDCGSGSGIRSCCCTRCIREAV